MSARERTKQTGLTDSCQDHSRVGREGLELTHRKKRGDCSVSCCYRRTLNASDEVVVQWTIMWHGVYIMCVSHVSCMHHVCMQPMSSISNVVCVCVDHVNIMWVSCEYHHADIAYLIVVNDHSVGRLLVSVRERVAYRCIRWQLHSSGLNRNGRHLKKKVNLTLIPNHTHTHNDWRICFYSWYSLFESLALFPCY